MERSAEKFDEKLPQDEEHETFPRQEDPRTRRCLMCATDFLSEWSGNRICKRCRSSAAYRSGE